jgi:hypothetical protein
VPAMAVASAPVGGLFQEHTFSTMLGVTANQAYPLVVGSDPILWSVPTVTRTEPIVTP